MKRRVFSKLNIFMFIITFATWALADDGDSLVFGPIDSTQQQVLCETPARGQPQDVLVLEVSREGLLSAKKLDGQGRTVETYGSASIRTDSVDGDEISFTLTQEDLSFQILGETFVRNVPEGKILNGMGIFVTPKDTFYLTCEYLKQ